MVEMLRVPVGRTANPLLDRAPDPLVGLYVSTNDRDRDGRRARRRRLRGTGCRAVEIWRLEGFLCLDSSENFAMVTLEFAPALSGY